MSRESKIGIWVSGLSTAGGSSRCGWASASLLRAWKLMVEEGDVYPFIWSWDISSSSLRLGFTPLVLVLRPLELGLITPPSSLGHLLSGVTLRNFSVSIITWVAIRVHLYRNTHAALAGSVSLEEPA